MRTSDIWWKRVDSNHRRRSQQIYSLSPLATWVLFHIQLGESGAGGRIRTPDLLITNQLLYQLSYTSTQRHFLTAKVIIAVRRGIVNTFFKMSQKIFTEFVGRREETEQSEGAGVLRFVPGGTVSR